MIYSFQLIDAGISVARIYSADEATSRQDGPFRLFDMTQQNGGPYANGSANGNGNSNGNSNGHSNGHSNGNGGL